MIIVGKYSFNKGAEVVQEKYPELLDEVEKVIGAVDAEQSKSKVSKEKTLTGRMLYSPVELNKAFKQEFNPQGWINRKVPCEYPTQYYTANYKPKPSKKKYPFRDIDFLKQKLGVEVQFGKYAFMVYNVCAKMTIFKNLGIIDTGIEIVPVKQFADQMSTGVSYFEQFVWDLEQRGIADIDIPVLILGIDSPVNYDLPELKEGEEAEIILPSSPDL